MHKMSKRQTSLSIALKRECIIVYRTWYGSKAACYGIAAYSIHHRVYQTILSSKFSNENGLAGIEKAYLAYLCARVCVCERACLAMIFNILRVRDCKSVATWEMGVSFSKLYEKNTDEPTILWLNFCD